ncbi:MAG: hypothetical protein ACK4UL_11875 [Novosphingobium meiothermophilum]
MKAALAPSCRKRGEHKKTQGLSDAYNCLLPNVAIRGAGKRKCWLSGSMVMQTPERHEADKPFVAERSLFCRSEARPVARPVISDALRERFAAFFAADFAAAMTEHQTDEETPPALAV